jgi:aryl-alcohol dehydrogenase-like predicted oxidoreductase
MSKVLPMSSAVPLVIVPHWLSTGVEVEINHHRQSATPRICCWPGCMGMSEFYGPSDRGASLKALGAAFEVGINFLDTADMYGRGHNEELIGEFIATSAFASSAVIATKFGISRDASDPYKRSIDNSRDYIRSACEASLRRLRCEAIDLYYVHRIDENRQIEDTVGDLAELVGAGKIKAIGLCEPSSDTIRRAHAIHPVAAVQSE